MIGTAEAQQRGHGMDPGKKAFVDWVRSQCQAAQLLINSKLDVGPLAYLQQPSNGGIGTFFERVDAWKAWASGFVSGLRGRLANGDHLARDAERRFSDELHRGAWK